jgi:hypothetical protein
VALIPVISMWLPWAVWAMDEWKTIETREHARLASLSGKRIAIHAALKWDEKAMELAKPYLTAGELMTTNESRLDILKKGGHIICTADVTVHRKLSIEDSADALIECETLRYGLILRNVKKITPIPAKGKQGIWYFDVPEIG